MRFPAIIRHRKAEAKIYGKSKNYPFYRVAAYVGGKRRMASYGTYSEARAAADSLVRDIAAGSQAAALTAGQANDALAALQRLEGLGRDTGRRVCLLAVAIEYAEAARKLNGRTLGQAVDGYLSTVVSVKRMDLGQAVEKFIQGRAHKTETKDGKRPQLSRGYHYIVSMWLREFANTFPNTAVCDLTKDLLNAYMSKHGDVSARTRNGRRTVVGMFLKWCVRQDYLAAGHRLLEADGMAQETSEPEAIDFYTPRELSGLLQTSSEKTEHRHLLPVIALCGLAGLRLQEAVRLTWEDVFRVDGHVEVSRTKSKTRARRLVAACPALAQWLAHYRGRSGLIWTHGLEKFHSDFGALRQPLKIPARRNGLRHAFVTYHFALHANENLTAAEAGNSPAMIHAHYKGLATKAEAEKWFDVTPPDSATNVIPLPAASRKPAR
jgi:integrase